MGPRGTSAWTLYSEVRNSGSKRRHSLRRAWAIFPADVEKQCEPERLQPDLTLGAPRSQSPVLLSSAERFSGAIRLISGTGWGHRAASGKHSHSSGVALCSWRLSPRTCLSSTHIPVLHRPPRHSGPRCPCARKDPPLVADHSPRGVAVETGVLVAFSSARLSVSALTHCVGAGRSNWFSRSS